MKIVQWASQYVGIPWRAHGDTRDGCDCWGVIRLIYCDVFEVKLSGPEYDDPLDTMESARALVAGVREYDWRRVASPAPGDVALLRIAGAPCHCGIYIGDKRMLHSTPQAGTVIERIDSGVWQRRVLGWFRHERGTVDA